MTRLKMTFINRGSESLDVTKEDGIDGGLLRKREAKGEIGKVREAKCARSRGVCMSNPHSAPRASSDMLSMSTPVMPSGPRPPATTGWGPARRVRRRVCSSGTNNTMLNSAFGD